MMERFKSKKKTSNNIAVPTSKRPSLRMRVLFVVIPENIATKPKINPKLKILDPTTLPTEIDDCPRKAAETVTANSGAEVAIATTVKPITSSDSPNRLAMLEADSTTQIAPTHKPATDTSIINEFKTNYIRKIIKIESNIII